MFHLHSSNKSIGLFVAIRQDFKMLHAEILHVTTMKPPSYITGIIGREITTKKYYTYYTYFVFYLKIWLLYGQKVLL